MALQAYIGFFVRHVIYNDPLGERFALILNFIFGMLYQTGLGYLLISWTGHMYVKAEVPRVGNENILNGLKDAVFVVDEDSRSVLFQNLAASNFNHQSQLSLQDNLSGIPEEKEIFDMNEVKFAPFQMSMIEASTLKNYDY